MSERRSAAARAGILGFRDADARSLAERQLTIDRERTAAFPWLFAHKLARMSASPLAFLRGAAPLFYEMLVARPELAEGPEGEGFIVGDMHLENFGAYRSEVLGKDRKHGVVFTLNDFDDTVVGPWRLDVLRLATSLLLAGRELGASGVVAVDLVRCLLASWARAAFADEALPSMPTPVEALVARVGRRSRKRLLDARTTVVGGRRRFVRGPRYANLDHDLSKRVDEAFAGYVASLAEEERPSDGSLEVLDSALRIAGTGSLGGFRVAVLVVGKGGPAGNWIFDLKEQGTPSASVLLHPHAKPSSRPRVRGGEDDVDPAERVARGFRACVARPPRMMGTTHLAGYGRRSTSLLGRRLTPQEDKLTLTTLRGDVLPDLARYLGALLGHAHARAATKRPRTRWNESDLRLLLDHAITLAGVHEAIYLALAARIAELPAERPAPRAVSFPPVFTRKRA